MWLRAVGAVLVLLCLPLPVAAQGGASFRASLTSGVPDGPTGIVLGDFDGDGLAEVATSHSDSGRIVINFLFRDEPVEFADVGSVQSGSVPSALLTGLFDDDRILDFVVANVNEGTIRFIRGASQGEFDFSFDLPGPPIPVGNSPVSLASADVDGDQILDVLVADRGSTDDAVGEVVVLRGAGDGTFSVATVVTAQIGTVGVAVGRIDVDSQLDVVAVNSGSSTVSTFFGRGGFAFDIGPSVATGAAPLAVALGDLNGDGALDVVTADSNSDTVSVLLSNRNRTFAPRVPYQVGTNPTAVAVGDVNGDGYADVVAANKRSSDVSVLFGDGSGQLPRVRHFVADEEPVALVLGSLLGNQAGPLDIVTVNAVAKTIAALFNRGETFDAVEDAPVGGPTIAVQAGDVDNDGFPDLVAARRDGPILVFRSVGDGFEPGRQVAHLRAALDLALVDFNGDERLDLAVLDDEGNQISILHGRGYGSFSNVVQNLTTGARPTALTTGDVDGDGRIDIAVVSIQLPAHVGLFRGRGDGRFGNRQSTQIPCPVAEGPCETEGPVPVDVVASDLNCDGAADLLVANSLSSTVAILLSNRDGTLRVSEQLSQAAVGRAPNALVVGDFNRDGQPDFASGAGVTQGGAVNVLFGSRSPCDATFRSGGSGFGGDRVAGLVARDFTGDALIDLASAYEVGNSVQLFPALRVEPSMLTAFGSGQSVRVSRRPLSIVAADFDGDGSYDLATANADPNASNVSVLTNAQTADVLRGDGNGDRKVTAADVAMLAREIGDGDGYQVEDVVLRNPQSRRGVDANGDGRVDRQDVLAHVARIFRAGG